MGLFAKRHSQRLMDFESAECQVQGNLVTLNFCEHHFRLGAIDLGGVGQLGLVRAIQTAPVFTRHLIAAPRHRLAPRMHLFKGKLL